MASQFAKPTGIVGRFILKGMNMGHARVTDWGIGLVRDVNPSSVLDIGCGGGMLIEKLGRMFPQACLRGLDISEESVKATAKKNSELVSASRLKVKLGSADNLPFGKERFDLVTAFETYFFWPDLEKCFAGIHDALKQGGTFLVVSEAYPHKDFEKRNEKYAKKFGINLRDNGEMEKLLSGCGFSVETRTVPENNWVAFIAKKV